MSSIVASIYFNEGTRGNGDILLNMYAPDRDHPTISAADESILPALASPFLAELTFQGPGSTCFELPLVPYLGQHNGFI
jgi:hypothetical protein